jgi:ABC-type multidrug transport system permease subunit
MVSGMVATMIAGRPVECVGNEAIVFDPPPGQTCGQYLAGYAQAAGGSIQNPQVTEHRGYCPLWNADQFLAGSSIYHSERWR